MSYYAILNNINTKQVYYDDNIIFYPTTRSGISTSDSFYYSTFGFTANEMKISFDEFGSLLSSNPSSTFSYINFNLNALNFYGICSNISCPTVVEISQITGYETGIGQTIFASGYNAGQKMIQNYSNPGNIYSINASGFSTSYFGNSISYLTDGIFGYVNYNDTVNHVSKYFLATPSNTWYELPLQQFYFDADYYVTLSPGFNFSNYVPLTIFNGVIPQVGQLILVNNANNNDVNSGLYIVTILSNNVYLSPSYLTYNYPGQTFLVTCNLDASNLYSYNSASYYVPYEFGPPSKCFSQNLQLNQYSSTKTFIPIYNDTYSFSSLILNLKTTGQLTKQSDSFQLGIAVSNWFPDSLLFGVSLNYEIKEGNV
jgi:hypothetical protein